MTAMVDLALRERDVVGGVVAGRTNREIADELGLTIQAVKNLRSAVFPEMPNPQPLELSAVPAAPSEALRRKNHT